VKRFLSILLALMLIFSLSSSVIFAQEEVEEGTEEQTEQPGEDEAGGQPVEEVEEAPAEQPEAVEEPSPETVEQPESAAEEGVLEEVEESSSSEALEEDAPSDVQEVPEQPEAAASGVSTSAFDASIRYSSAYQIQNLENVAATVQIQYYDQTAGTLSASGSISVPANGSKTIFPFTTGTFGDNITGPATFNGSAVLSSDRQIAAILNTQTSSSPFYGAATDGFSQGATSISLPLIACNNSGFDTWFNIQNTGSAAANVTVTYVPGSSGATGQTDTAAIQPNAAKTFHQATGSPFGTKTCAQLAGADGRFVGSAQITSNQPVVASVMFLGTGGGKTLQGYNGFTAGADQVNLPLIMANNSSFYTAIQVQNAGDASTNVTIDFGANTIGSGNPVDETFALAAGEAKTLIQLGPVSAFSPSNNWTAVGQYVSGATITQSGNEPLVAIVNQNSTASTSLGSAYEGFSPTGATTTINLPLVAANNSGFLTGIQIQALQDGTNVTIDYSTNTGSGSLTEPVNDTFTLNAGGSKTLIQAGAPGPLSGLNNWATAGQYVGSATVTANNPVIAIVNFNGPASGDTFFTYTGFNR
jgi:hypothetical protein